MVMKAMKLLWGIKTDKTNKGCLSSEVATAETRDWRRKHCIKYDVVGRHTVCLFHSRPRHLSLPQKRLGLRPMLQERELEQVRNDNSEMTDSSRLHRRKRADGVQRDNESRLKVRPRRGQGQSAGSDLFATDAFLPPTMNA
jgi:hypothetical protein